MAQGRCMKCKKQVEIKNGKEVKIDNIIINIGFENNISFLKNIVELNEMNEIIINDRCETSEKGIFAPPVTNNKLIFGTLFKLGNSSLG